MVKRLSSGRELNVDSEVGGVVDGPIIFLSSGYRVERGTSITATDG